jgi:hypothetical protein
MYTYNFIEKELSVDGVTPASARAHSHIYKTITQKVGDRVRAQVSRKRGILLIYLFGGKLGRVGRKDSVNVARVLLLLLHAAVVLGHFFLRRGWRGLPGVGRGSTHHHHLRRHHATVLALPRAHRKHVTPTCQEVRTPNKSQFV